MSARRVLFSVAVLSLPFFAACASSQRSSAAPPVKVVVSSDPAVSRYVRVDKLTQVIEAALRKYAAAASPATITVRFTAITADQVNSHIDMRWNPEPGGGPSHTVPIISSTPWTEPVKPTATATRPMTVMPISSSGMRPALRGTYTITDANGAVLEEKVLYMGLDYGDGFSNRLDEQRVSATYLAKRVAALTRKQG